MRAVRIHLGMPDASGRQTPQEIPNSHVNIEADLVIKALGFDPEDLPALFDAPDLGVTGWGTLKIDWRSMMTSLDGVFAAGDIVRGASLVVWAVRDGRDAAERIHSYLTTKAAAAVADRRGVTTMMTLYDFMGSGNGYKVRLVLAHLGLPYKLVERDILKGETRTPEFLAKNPNGRIPDAAARGRQPTSPSRTPSSGTWPRAPGSRRTDRPGARRDAAMDVLRAVQPRALHRDGALLEALPAQAHAAAGDGAAGTHGEGLRRARRHGAASRASSVLRRRPYGLADIALYAYTHVAGEGGFNLDNFPHVNAWLARVAAQPGHVTIDHKN